MKLKYDQTTARQDVLGIVRQKLPGHVNRQETRTTRTNESPGKAKRQGKCEAPGKRRRGNAKKKRAHLGLINGASDSVGKHVGTDEDQ